MQGPIKVDITGHPAENRNFTTPTISKMGENKRILFLNWTTHLSKMKAPNSPHPSPMILGRCFTISGFCLGFITMDSSG